MSENPYQPPASSEPAIGVLSGSREDLRTVATMQKGILVCILLQIIGTVGQVVSPPGLAMAFAGLALITGIASFIFVLLLAMRVYGVGMGILLGVLCMIPCIGLISLLVVNGKATSVLRQNGIKVGLMGAKLSDIS